MLSQHFIIIQSDRVFCPLTKLMDTIEHMNGQQQSRKDPDETVRMHRLILTFAIRIQLELTRHYTRQSFFFFFFFFFGINI